MNKTTSKFLNFTIFIKKILNQPQVFLRINYTNILYRYNNEESLMIENCYIKKYSYLTNKPDNTQEKGQLINKGRT